MGDPKRETKTEPPTPKPMTSADDVVFGALEFKEISEFARDAAKRGDPQEMRDASKLAYQRTQAATLEVKRGGAMSPELTLAVDGAYEALWELWLAVESTNDGPTYGYLTERSIALIDATCVPLKWVKPQGPAARKQRADAAASKKGATTVSSSDRGKLGRLHMANARRTITTGTASIKAGRFDAVVSSAASDLYDALSLLNDPDVTIADLESEVTATNKLLDTLTIELDHQGRSFSLLAELARNQDGLLTLAKQVPRWVAAVDANVKAHTPAPTPTVKGEIEETLLIPPVHYERYIILTNGGRGQQDLGRIVVMLTAKLYTDGQVSVVPDMRAEMYGEAADYLSVTMAAPVKMPPFSLPSGEHRNQTILQFNISGPQVTETGTTSASVGGKSPAAGGEASGGAGVTNSTASSWRGALTATRGFEFISNASTSHIAMTDMAEMHKDIHALPISGEARGGGFWTPAPKNDWIVNSR